MAHRKFFASQTRGPRDGERVQLHILLTKEERQKLIELSHRMQTSASEVIRHLLSRARA